MTSLSDKIRECEYESGHIIDPTGWLLAVDDVRAAVKELKDRNDTCGCPCCNSWAKDIDEIFGSKLI